MILRNADARDLKVWCHRDPTTYASREEWAAQQRRLMIEVRTGWRGVGGDGSLLARIAGLLGREVAPSALCWRAALVPPLNRGLLWRQVKGERALDEMIIFNRNEI